MATEVVLDEKAPDAATAVAQAWATYKPGFSRPLRASVDIPDRDGWTAGKRFSYETSPNEKAVVVAIARRAGDTWNVMLLDGSEATFGKRGAQINLIVGSARPKGYQRESFAGRKPLPLTDERIEALRSFVETSMKKLDVPGVGFALIDQGRVVYEGGIGVKELGKPDRVDAKAVDSVRVDGANYEELRDAKECVRDALAELPNNATGRQIAGARDQALLPLAARVAERIGREQAQRQRDEAQRQRDLVLSSLHWHLPFGISDDDRESALAEIQHALRDLPADASQREMEQARNEILEEYQREHAQKVKRAERQEAHAKNKANLIRYGLTQIGPYAEHMLRKFDYAPSETVWGIDLRTRTEVRKALEDELTGRETKQEVGRIVRRSCERSTGATK